MTTQCGCKVSSVFLAPKESRNIDDVPCKNRVLLILAWAFLILWPGRLWLWLPPISGYIFCRCSYFMPPTESLKIILFGCNCRRWEAEGISWLCHLFPQQEGDPAFLAGGWGVTMFSCPCVMGCFFPHSEQMTLVVLFLSPGDGDLWGGGCGCGGRLLPSAWCTGFGVRQIQLLHF